MNKFYKELTDEELRQEIKRLESLQNPKFADHDLAVSGTTYLEKCQKELDLRQKLNQ